MTMEIVSLQEVLDFLCDPAATEANTRLFAEIANQSVIEAWHERSRKPVPYWVKVIVLEVAERGWVKFAKESADDWSGERSNVARGMALTDDERARLATTDGIARHVSAYVTDTGP